MTKSLKCEICNSDTNLFLKFDQWNLYKCKKCEFIKSDTSKELLEKIYEPEFYLSKFKDWFEYTDYDLFKLLIEKVRQLGLEEDNNILDIGCGTGIFLEYLWNEGFTNLNGIDVVPMDFRLKTKINYLVGNVMEIKFPKKYDIVFCLEVVQHIQNINKFISRIKNILSQKGILVITTPNTKSTIYRLSTLFYRLGFKSPAERLNYAHHLNLFNKYNLTNLFSANGFNMVFYKSRNHPLGKITGRTAKVLSGLIFFISIFEGSKIEQIAILTGNNSRVGLNSKK